MEKVEGNYWSIVSTGSIKNLTGFGVPTAVNTGCNISHRCLVYRRDLELRGHQQVAERCHRWVSGRTSTKAIMAGSPADFSGNPYAASPSQEWVDPFPRQTNVFLTSLRYYSF
jgi:hypothetical protein